MLLHSIMVYATGSVKAFPKAGSPPSKYDAQALALGASSKQSVVGQFPVSPLHGQAELCWGTMQMRHGGNPVAHCNSFYARRDRHPRPSLSYDESSNGLRKTLTYSFPHCKHKPYSDQHEAACARLRGCRRDYLRPLLVLDAFQIKIVSNVR